MKNKYLIIQVILGILLVGFVSCSDSDPFVDCLKSKRFEVSTESITLESGQRNGEFKVTAKDIEWYVYSLDYWIHIDGPSYGDYSKTVTFTVDDNNSSYDREGHIKVYTDKPIFASYSIEIKQERPIEVDMITTNYKADGDYRYLYVTAGSSQSWTIKRNYSDSWVHLGSSYNTSTTYNGNGTKSVEIYVDKNTGSSERSATLTVTSGSTTKTITITQDVGFNATMPTTNYKAEGDFWWLYVTAGSSQSWTIKRNSTDSWVHLGSSNSTSTTYYGYGTESVKIYVDKNTGNSRSTTLTVTCGSTTKSITITQDASAQAFEITSVEIANVEYSGTIINDYGSTIYSYQTKYLQPKLNINVNMAGTYTVYTKLYKPSGTYYNNPSTSPSGYTYSDKITIYSNTKSMFLSGWGSRTAGFYAAGTYRWEFYLEGKKIGEKSFTIY